MDSQDILQKKENEVKCINIYWLIIDSGLCSDLSKPGLASTVYSTA